MSSRFAEYIVLALNEKLITGIIEFFLLFNVILSRGHREPSLFTHARARATMRDHGVTRSPLPKDNRQKNKTKSRSRSLYDLRFRTFSTDGENYVSGVHIYALLYDPLCFIAYRIHSIKRLGVYKIFRDFFIRGRRLFKIQYIYKAFSISRFAGSHKISNCDQSIDRRVLFESIIRINAAS